MTTPSAPLLAGPSRYARMNGIGNAILVVDRRGLAPLDGASARALCARPDLAFDQLMALGDPRHEGTDAFVDIFNADGSRAGACGNGTRCVAWFLLDGTASTTTVVETDGGVLACRRDGPWHFTVDMGAPRLGWRDIPLRDAIGNTRAFAVEPHAEWIAALGPASAVSMGNPHIVFWLPPDAQRPPIERFGPALEHNSMFPDRANISFARVIARDHLVLDVWERGAGLTRACGSAACATLVAAVRLGLTERRAAVHLPGGVLDIAWRESDGHVLMSGAVALDAAGVLQAEELGAPA